MLTLTKKLKSIKLNKKHAIVVVLLMVAWFLYGTLRHKPEMENASKTKTKITPILSTIRVHLEKKIVQLHLNGIVDTRGNINLMSQTAGKVESVKVRKGGKLKKGDTIALIELNDKQANLEKAETILKQRQLEYNSALSLHKQGYEHKASLAAKLSALKAADSAVKSAQIALKNCNITSPINAVVEQIDLKPGMTLLNNTRVARLIKCDEYIVKTSIPAKNITQLNIGTAKVMLPGEYGTLDGKITSVALEANNKTHTYEAEINVPALNNQCHNIIGMTSNVILNLYETGAYKIPSYALSLSDQGIAGIKTINKDKIVEFHPVELLEEDQGGYFWCKIEKPQKVITIISKGHTYVQSGEKVEFK